MKIISTFDKRLLRGDVFGGITAAIVAISLALAFGIPSGLGAIYGLYGAYALGMVAAISGGTAYQASGPTGPMTVFWNLLFAVGVGLVISKNPCES